MIPAVVLIAYLLLLAGIGAWSSRRAGTLPRFFLAERGLGLLTVVLATMSSIMSGFVFVGGPGLFYSVGLGSFWIVISGSFTGAMMCWLLAKPLHRMAEARGCMTIPDVILDRYACRFTAGFSALAILLGVVGYLATQMLALGVILGAVLGTSAPVGLLIGVGVLVFYTTAGGMVAAVYTDIIQGAVMLITALGAFLLAATANGGIPSVSKAIIESSPQVLGPWGIVGAGTCLGWFFLFSVGSLGQPHVVHKFMMLRDLRTLKHFPWILAVCMMICSLLWLGVGLSVTGLVASGRLAPLSNPDQAVSVFLASFAPVALLAVAYAGIVSAIMSTADSFANIGAAVLAWDLPKALGRMPGRGVGKARILSLTLFAVSCGLAVSSGELVAYLGILSFGIFAASLTPPLALGLNWPQAGVWSARASVVLGAVMTIAGEALSRFGFYPFSLTPPALALVLSFLLFLVVGLGSPSRSR